MWKGSCICVYDLSAVLSGGLSSQSLDLLSIKLGCTAVIFSIGFTGSATMLVKKGRLQEGERKIYYSVSLWSPYDEEPKEAQFR